MKLLSCCPIKETILSQVTPQSAMWDHYQVFCLSCQSWMWQHLCCAFIVCNWTGATINQLWFNLNDEHMVHRMSYNLCNFSYLHPIPLSDWDNSCPENGPSTTVLSKMLGSLKERLTGLGESMTRWKWNLSQLKRPYVLFFSGIGEHVNEGHNIEPVDLQAGAHLLTHFQVTLYSWNLICDIWTP